MQVLRATTPAYSLPSLARASGFSPAALRKLLGERRLSLVGQVMPQSEAKARHVRGSTCDAFRLLVSHRLMHGGGLTIPQALEALAAVDRLIVDLLAARTITLTPAVLVACLDRVQLVVNHDPDHHGLRVVTQLAGAPVEPFRAVCLVLDLGALADLSVKLLRGAKVRRVAMPRLASEQPSTDAERTQRSTGGGRASAGPHPIPNAGPTAQPSKEPTCDRH